MVVVAGMAVAVGKCGKVDKKSRSLGDSGCQQNNQPGFRTGQVQNGRAPLTWAAGIAGRGPWPGHLKMQGCATSR